MVNLISTSNDETLDNSSNKNNNNLKSGTHSSNNTKKPEKEKPRNHLLWETDITKKTRSIIAFQLFFPFVIIFSFYITLYFFMDWTMFSRLGAGSILYFIPPAGKESVIPGMISKDVNPYLIVMDIVFIDVIISIFLIWNFDYVKKVPLFGDLIDLIERKSQKYLKGRKFAKGGVYVMLILFVMVPFEGSGGAASTIIGKIIGMKPYRIWACVWIGSFIGVSLITKAALEAQESLGEDLIWVVIGIFVIAGIYAFINYINGRLKEKKK
jgi:hypothetical protein